MIVDAHFHTFPRFGTGERAELNMKLFQYHMRDARTFWRMGDGSRVDRPLLDFASDDINDMPDVNFRVGNLGRLEITIEDVDYYLQCFTPSGLDDMAAPAKKMVAEMDAVGINMAVLQSDHIYGSLNEYYGECIQQYPGRFVGLAQIQEWEADRPAQHDQLERAILEEKLSGLYFSVEPFAFNNWSDHLHDTKFDPLWDRVRALEIPVWWYLAARWRNQFAAIMQYVAELDRWAETHPDIPAVLTHGIDTFKKGVRPDEVRYQIPEHLMTLLQRPNMNVELLFHSVYRWPEYPYLGAQEMIKRLRGELGIEKLMWGSDMPTTWNWCTYRQSLDYIRSYCDFLSEEEKSLILGGNVARMFNLR